MGWKAIEEDIPDVDINFEPPGAPHRLLHTCIHDTHTEICTHKEHHNPPLEGLMWKGQCSREALV